MTETNKHGDGNNENAGMDSSGFNQSDLSSIGTNPSEGSIQDTLGSTIEKAEITTEAPATLKYEAEVYDVDGELSDSQESHSSSRSKHPANEGISWKFILLIIVILLPIRLFVAEPFLVYGSSMEPNFDTGDYLIVDELSYKLSDPKRGDVVVLQPPTDPTKHFIKRIVGLPNETIDVKGDRVKIFNAEHPEGLVLSEPYLKFFSDKEAHYVLNSDQYFVMGDNRTVSYDSRSWGPLSKEKITGKAFLRLYPFNSISILPGDASRFTSTNAGAK